MGRVGGVLCGLGEFFLTKNPFFFFFFFFFFFLFFGGGGVYRLSRNPNLTLFYLCKIILKSMHICRSYGPEKLIYLTFKCGDLDLQPT